MSKHCLNRLRNYLEIHETVMDQFRRDGFVVSDALVLTPEGRGHLRLAGTIACLGGIEIDVEKTLQLVRPDATPLLASELHGGEDHVRTVRYRYNVRIRGRFNVFRYDNAHRHEGHADEHHKDLYDWKTGKRLRSEWIGPEWPTLGEVIDEAKSFYWDNYEAIE